MIQFPQTPAFSFFYQHVTNNINIHLKNRRDIYVHTTEKGYKEHTQTKAIYKG